MGCGGTEKRQSSRREIRERKRDGEGRLHKTSTERERGKKRLRDGKEKGRGMERVVGGRGRRRRGMRGKRRGASKRRRKEAGKAKGRVALSRGTSHGVQDITTSANIEPTWKAIIDADVSLSIRATSF